MTKLAAHAPEGAVARPTGVATIESIAEQGRIVPVRLKRRPREFLHLAAINLVNVLTLFVNYSLFFLSQNYVW